MLHWWNKTRIHLLLVILLILGQGMPASAHAMRVFARVGEAEVSGYAFFVGGGRPRGALWSAVMQGKEVASGQTDTDGGFAFAAPQPVTDEVVITVDTREGHVATARLGPERFDLATAGPETGQVPAMAPTASSRPADASNGQSNDMSNMANLVETAVERQIAPLLERIEQMDARLRFSDIISGLCLIFGLAGMGLWASGRRR